MAVCRHLGIALLASLVLACGGQGSGGADGDRFDDTENVALVVTANDNSVEAGLGDYTVAATLDKTDDTFSIQADELIYPVYKATSIALDAPIERVFVLEVRESAEAEWEPLRPEQAGETWTWTELAVSRSYGQFQFAGNGAPYGGLSSVVQDVQIARDMQSVQLRILAIPGPNAPGDYETGVSLSRLTLE